MDLTNSLINSLLYTSTIQSYRYGTITQLIIQELMENLTISTNVLGLVRDVNGNEIDFKFKNENVENETDISEIKERIENIKGINEYLNRVAMTPFIEFCVHEKVYKYNEETGNLELKELVYVPQHLVNFDIRINPENGWYLSSLVNHGKNGVKADEYTNGRIPLTEEKFIIDVFNQTVEHPMGYGLFRYGILSAYYDLNDLESKMRDITNKYGNIIPVFGYNSRDIETEEGMKKLNQRVEALTVGEGVKALAIPLGTYTTNLKDGFQTISLSDLKIDMHLTIMSRLEDKIEKFITNSRFSKTDSGSQAKDAVMQDEKEKMVKQISKTVIVGMKKILTDDSEIFGYSPKNIDIFLKEIKGEETLLELESTKLDNTKKKTDNSIVIAENYSKIKSMIADLKFRNMTDEDVAEITGMNIKFIENIEASEYQEPIETNSTNSFIKEFSKKKALM
jgi:hypothetical protein